VCPWPPAALQSVPVRAAASGPAGCGAHGTGTPGPGSLGSGRGRVILWIGARV
jgi:hypothetical protein